MASLGHNELTDLGLIGIKKSHWHLANRPMCWYMYSLTRLPQVLHICISESGQHWFRKWLVAYSALSHYLNQCWGIVNWTLTNKLHWKFNQNTKLFIHENASENSVCEKAAILSRGDKLNISISDNHSLPHVNSHPKKNTKHFYKNFYWKRLTASDQRHYIRQPTKKPNNIILQDTKCSDVITDINPFCAEPGMFWKWEKSICKLAHWPKRCGSNFAYVIFKQILVICILNITGETDLRWMLQDLTDNKSTLVQAMAWCHQAICHCLNQCWPSYITSYGITKGQWVKPCLFTLEDEWQQPGLFYSKSSNGMDAKIYLCVFKTIQHIKG